MNLLHDLLKQKLSLANLFDFLRWRLFEMHLDDDVLLIEDVNV